MLSCLVITWVWVWLHDRSNYMAALCLFIAWNSHCLTISNTFCKHNHCWIFLELLIYVRYFPWVVVLSLSLQVLSYFSCQKKSQELRTSYLLQCLQSPSPFLPCKCQFNSVADDLCLGYVADWRATEVGLWLGWLERSPWHPCDRTQHMTSLLSNLYHSVLTGAGLACLQYFILKYVIIS